MPSIRINGSIPRSAVGVKTSGQRQEARGQRKTTLFVSSRWPSGLWPVVLVNSYSIHRVILSHVGNQDLVPDIQTREHFDQVYRRLAELHVRPNRGLSIRLELEQPNGLVGLRVSGTLHKHRIRDPVDLDRSVDAEVRAGAGRHFTLQPVFHDTRGALGTAVVAHHPALHDGRVQVNVDPLADIEILRLCLPDTQHGLEAARLCDTRQLGSRIDPLPQFEVQALELAIDTRFHVQALDAIAAQLYDGLVAVHRVFGAGDLLSHRAFHQFQSALFNAEGRGQFNDRLTGGLEFIL